MRARMLEVIRFICFAGGLGLNVLLLAIFDGGDWTGVDSVTFLSLLFIQWSWLGMFSVSSRLRVVVTFWFLNITHLQK